MDHGRGVGEGWRDRKTHGYSFGTVRIGAQRGAAVCLLYLFNAPLPSKLVSRSDLALGGCENVSCGVSYAVPSLVQQTEDIKEVTYLPLQKYIVRACGKLVSFVKVGVNYLNKGGNDSVHVADVSPSREGG